MKLKNYLSLLDVVVCGLITILVLFSIYLWDYRLFAFFPILVEVHGIGKVRYSLSEMNRNSTE